jgi:hypothetical protein
MSNNNYRGVVRGGTVVLLEKSPTLTEGTEVLVTPIGQPGTAAAVLAAVEAPPHVPPEWVDELEQMIAGGRRSPMRNPLFEEEHPNREE